MPTITEKVLSFEGLSIFYRKGIETNNQVIHALHTHDSYEIIYFIDGAVNYQIEDKIYYAIPGDLLLIPSQKFHRIFTLSDKYERFVINIDRKLNSLFAFDVDFFNLFAKTQKSNSCIIQKEKVISNNIDKDLYNILDLCKEKTKKNNVRICCKLILFLLNIDEMFITPEYENIKKSNEIISSIFSFIDDNLHKKFSLDDLSNHLFLSKFYLCRLFKKETGISIVSYIQKKRILEAHSQIICGTPAITASVNVGFNNYSNFYKAYKKILGYKPSDLNK